MSGMTYKMFEELEILRQETEEKNETSSDKIVGPDIADIWPSTVFAKQDGRGDRRFKKWQVPEGKDQELIHFYLKFNFCPFSTSIIYHHRLVIRTTTIQLSLPTRSRLTF